VPESGVVVYDSSVVAQLSPLRPGVKAVGVPFTQVAADLGKVVVKNVVALGALQESTRLFPKETFLTAIRQALADKSALIPLNEQAFARGVEKAAEAAKGDA
jgi:2-oxoisovalerate ferredoxin oxidoreductase beta subunit